MLHTIRFSSILALLSFHGVQVCAEVIEVEATVKAFDAKMRTISVEVSGKSKKFDVSSKAKIVVDGKEVSLDALKVGQKVRLSYHDELEVVVALEVATKSSTKAEDISLFDGKTLDGWKMPDFDQVQGWQAKDGALVALPLKDVPFLLTEDSFDDFEFECEFWLDTKGNSGVFLRGRYEVQLIDDDSFPQAPPKNRCGSIVGQLAPSKAVYQGPRKWNTLFVRLERKTVTVKMNGTTIINKRLIENVTQSAIDDLEDEPGPIALQNQGGLARFKNLKIRPLNK